MAVTMTHKEWMKLTDCGMFKPRSKALKAVDEAFLKYEELSIPGYKDILKQQLETWMASKQGGWKQSIRNRKNAISSLHKQLTGIPVQRNAVAMDTLAAATNQTVKLLFTDAKLTWKGNYDLRLEDQPKPRKFITRAIVQTPEVAYSRAGNNKLGLTGATSGIVTNSTALAGGDITAVPGAMGAAAQSVDAARPTGAMGHLMSAVKDAVVPKGSQNEVFAAIVKFYPGFERELAAAVLPFVGVASAAASTVYSFTRALQWECHRHAVQRHGARIYAGETPKRAIDGMITIIRRERNVEAFAGSVSLGELGGKLAGTLADGGTATNAALGLAASLIKLMNLMRVVHRDIEEMKAANRAIQAGVTLDTFATSPLVGCYFVACAPTSVLMDLLQRRLGEEGWMDLGERAIQSHLAPLKAAAVELIHLSRFEITKLKSFPALMAPNKAKLQKMKAGAEDSLLGGPYGFAEPMKHTQNGLGLGAQPAAEAPALRQAA